MEPELAIIMVNYKDYADKYLADSYNSLSKAKYPKNKYRLYIADNESSPASRAKIRELAPDAVIVATAGNGWGHGNNQAARKALADGFGQYFFFVNMDTEFEPEFLLEAVKVAQNEAKGGIVQSKILLYSADSREALVNSAGNSLTFLGFGFSAGNGQADAGGLEAREICYASGAGFLVSRDLFLAVGMCDESLFMYHDDLELCFKARLLGQKIYLAPRSVIYHKYEFGRSSSKIYYMERNRLRFLLEFYRWPTLALIAGPFLFMEIGLLAYAFKNGWLGAKFKVYLYFLNPKNIIFLLNKRRILRSIRTVGDRELLRLVGAEIKFQEISNPLLDVLANPLMLMYWRIVKKLII